MSDQAARERKLLPALAPAVASSLRLLSHHMILGTSHLTCCYARSGSFAFSIRRNMLTCMLHGYEAVLHIPDSSPV